MKLRFSLGTCGRCRQPIGNPLTHVCVVRNDRAARRGPTRIRPAVAVDRKCPACGKKAPNPLRHTCVTKRRAPKRNRIKRTVNKPRRVKVVRTGGPPQHNYAACRDDSCKRRTCIAYREGFADGAESGRR